MMTTKLWLMTYHVDGDGGDFEGVSAQRLCVADADWGDARVTQLVERALEEIYLGKATLENVTPVRDLASLAKGLLGLDLTKSVSLESVPADCLPAKLVVEVGYDDYGPDQETPSRQEVLFFPSTKAADEAARAVNERADEAYPKKSWLVNVFLDATSGPTAETPGDAVGLLDEMMQEMYGEGQKEGEG